MKHGKKYMDSLKKYDPSKAYDVPAACQLVKDLHYVKFDETVELSVTLKLEKNQTVRDTLVFPHQFTAEKRVLVFCKEERVKEALDELGFDLNAIEDEEPDAALGNAGRTPLRPQKSGKRHRSGKE